MAVTETPQKLSPTATVSTFPTLNQEQLEASRTAEATPSSVVEKVVEKKVDITQPQPEVKSKLESYLADNPPGPLSVTNFLQHAIRAAINQRVPVNTIVLLLLFPLVAAVIAAARHLVGVGGLGIFTPAVLSVAFVATGLLVGVLLFLVMLSVATASRLILRKLKLQYLPRMSLLLWLVAVGVLGTLIVSPYLKLENLVTISIFPILILMLLTETFVDLQVGKSVKEARDLTFETLLIALVCSLIFSLESLQKTVLLYPEATLLTVAAFNIFLGKYTGLRLLEYKKFKEILK